MFRKLLWLIWAMLITTHSMAAEEGALEPGGVNPGFHEQPSWFKQSFLDLQDDVNEATEHGKRLVLYFYQDGCPYCAKLLQDNFGQREIVGKTRRHFDVVAINMWGDREVTDFAGHTLTEKQLAAQFKVMYTPTLLFFDDNANLVLRLNGYYHPGKFALALDYAASPELQKSSFRDFLARQGDIAKASGTLHDEPYFIRPPYILDRQAVSAERPLLVLFEQKECRTCDEFHTAILARPAIKELMQQLDVVQLDMWSATPLISPSGEKTNARAWADRLEVKYAPSLVYFDEQGNEVFRSEAYLRAFHTQAVLEYIVSGAYRTQPNLQRYIQERAEHMRESGEEVDLWE